MKGQTPDSIPPSVVRRLTRYLTHIEDLMALGKDWVASRELAEALGLTSSTVRQDLSYLDFWGISKKGYRIPEFRKVLTHVLGVDSEWKLVVIGAGNLGRALVLHDEFRQRGLNICGVFDNDPQKVGKKFGPLIVQRTAALPSFATENHVDIGVISVPAPAAQAIADLLIASRVRGILNLSLRHIVSPAWVSVVDTRIASSLMELCHSLKRDSTPKRPQPDAARAAKT